MSNESNQIERNFAYYKLVNDENDFVGMIAYTIYKKAKIEYLKQLKQELTSFLFTFISILIYLFLDKGFDLTSKIIGYFK